MITPFIVNMLKTVQEPFPDLMTLFKNPFYLLLYLCLWNPFHPAEDRILILGRGAFLFMGYPISDKLRTDLQKHPFDRQWRLIRSFLILFQDTNLYILKN